MVCYPVMMYFLIGIGVLIIFLLWDIQPIRSTLKKMPAWNFVGRKMGIKLINLLTRIRILKEKNNEKYINKIKRICDNYMIGSEYIKSNVHTVINIFLITLVQRMFLLAVTWIVYKSYGLSGTGFWNIIALQTMIGVAVEMLPLPGAAGA